MDHEAKKTALFIGLEDAVELDQTSPVCSKMPELRELHRVVVATVLFQHRDVGARERDVLSRFWGCGATLIALSSRIRRYDPTTEDVSPIEGYIADLIVAQGIGRVVLPRRDVDFLPLAQALRALGVEVEFGIWGLLSSPCREEAPRAARLRPTLRPAHAAMSA